MERDELEQSATPEQLAQALDEHQADLARLHQPPDHPGRSVREVSYKGHQIRIVTNYEVEVDGVPVTGHVLVNEEGRVHYGGIPNQEFASMVDVVKRIIDLSPEGLVEPPPYGNGGEEVHGGSDTGGRG